MERTFFEANPFGRTGEQKVRVIYQKGDTVKRALPVQYIGGLFKGNRALSMNLAKRSWASIPSWSIRMSLYEGRRVAGKGRTWESRSDEGGRSLSCKYVFYIIKENRPYDQVLGDVSEGNGDSSLVLFGKRITESAFTGK